MNAVGVEDRGGEIEGRYVRRHLELCLPGPNAAALDAWTSAAVDELGGAHSLGHLGDLLSLLHLSFVAAEVVVLHAEDAMDAIQGHAPGIGDRGSARSALTTSAPSWAMARAFFPSGFLVGARTGQWSCSLLRQPSTVLLI